MLHDAMTEEEYLVPIASFDCGVSEVKPVRIIPVMEEGKAALERLNGELGLGFDEFDLDYYTNLFKEKLQRNPTDVECFDMGQSNSEHSRHWFFGGKQVLNGVEQPHTLFQMVKSTLDTTRPNDNSIIAFYDNSSSIRGYECTQLLPTAGQEANKMELKSRVMHPILTAETHNFPCGVAPFPGAETGTGGRLRDVMATGRGAYPIAGISSYCVGNLQIPQYELPWEDKTFDYPENLAAPLKICVEASNGASDYGNKYGEPVILGFTRSFGQRIDGKRVEWVKPIMFSAGIGLMDDAHKKKGEPEVGHLVVKIGGPCYRIGIGGGAASSRVQDGDASEQKLDFDAVQRGDAEMENRLNRLMRACCDLGKDNPIVSVHDQGAGGNGNVLKEITEPAGAVYDIAKVYLGDDTLSVLEIWGSEYQENNALLIHPSSAPLFKSLAARERCPMRILGTVTGDGRVVVKDSRNGSTPVDLPLELVLGKMPQKTFVDAKEEVALKGLELPTGVGVQGCLGRVLKLLSVGSKRFLVHKVDRSVTGLVAQQQCVGPLQIPLSNVAVTAHSHFSTTGTAVSCGEQPIKGLVDAAAMARMTVAESLTNLVWARISGLQDVKASGNWMYAAKLPGEGSKMYAACEALRDSLLILGVSIDGGKDSLSMAAKCGNELVKSPGELTMTCYVTCPDIRKTVTPDLKAAGGSTLLLIDLGGGMGRCGGSALAQCYNQIGDVSPDLDDDGLKLLKTTFEVTQELIEQEVILAGHDRSDGGLIVTLLEMAFSGNCGLDVTVPACTKGLGSVSPEIATLFAEEVGMVLEIGNDNVENVLATYKKRNVPCVIIGTTTSSSSTSSNDATISISVGDSKCLDGELMTTLRDTWEETSFQLETLQRNPSCVAQEQEHLKSRTSPSWKLSYVPKPTSPEVMSGSKHKVAILRQEGSNGDREMQSAFQMAGFEVWDVTTHDLLEGNVSLDQFRGLVFVGGFSYADVLDSGKGWAGVILFSESVKKQFEEFKNRKDTFSLGVCNGCQLMALLGWIPSNDGLNEKEQPRLLENESEKFESRFSSVTILDSPAVMFKGMQGSSLGVWIAHGEGRFHFPSSSILTDHVLPKSLAPLRYINDASEITSQYPFNPNGSPEGIAALCSDDGRHLAMMPHPERVFLEWQWPWMPDGWKGFEGGVGPWLTMFQNARVFCDES